MAEYITCPACDGRGGRCSACDGLGRAGGWDALTASITKPNRTLDRRSMIPLAVVHGESVGAWLVAIAMIAWAVGL